MAHSFVRPHSIEGNAWSDLRSSIVGLFSETDANEGESFRYLLLLRFVLINSVAAFFLALIWHQGWLSDLLAGESAKLLALIIGVFLFGLFWCGQKVVAVSRELNSLDFEQSRKGDVRSSRVSRYFSDIAGLDGQSRANIAAALRLKLSSRIATIRHMANSLVILGLIGTVIGFMIALSGVDPDVVSDISAVGPMVSTLISGMSVALYTTLVGAVLNVWLMVNYRLLEGGTVNLFTKLVEAGERNARL